MAGAGLLMLLDDIASMLDDVALMTKTAAGKSTAILDDVATQTKVAVQKTAGVLGDDLALNAEQVTGVKANRELPVVWAVAKGSLMNKAILVPAALLISAFVPWLITPLLMVGGAFLCFEGVEKILELFHKHKKHDAHDAVVDAEEAAHKGVAPKVTPVTVYTGLSHSRCSSSGRRVGVGGADTRVGNACSNLLGVLVQLNVAHCFGNGVAYVLCGLIVECNLVFSFGVSVLNGLM